MENLTDKFIADVLSPGEAGFSRKIQNLAQYCLIDYLAASFAGCTLLEDKLEGIVNVYGDGDFPIFGSKYRTSLSGSAFVNGLISHAAELDDGVISGIIHPGTPIFSALLPIAKHYKISGTKLLEGAVIGYEAAVRLAEAIQPSHKLLGYHATATCGSIGAVFAVMAALESSQQYLRNALAISMVSAAGTLKALEGESEIKPYNSAEAAARAVNAVNLSLAGFSGPQDPLNGRFGFFEMMTDDVDYNLLFPSAESRALSIEKVYVKPYAACRYCHSPIDAALEVVEVNELIASEIESIEVATYELAVRGHDHFHVDNVSSAKMSIPFSVAQFITLGDLGTLGFTDKEISNPDILNLASKIKVIASDDLTSSFPEKSPARVSIKTLDGNIYSASVNYPKGEPQTPLTEAEFLHKFAACAGQAGLDDGRQNEIVQSIFELDDKPVTLFDYF